MTYLLMTILCQFFYIYLRLARLTASLLYLFYLSCLENKTHVLLFRFSVILTDVCFSRHMSFNPELSLIRNASSPECTGLKVVYYTIIYVMRCLGGINIPGSNSE